MRRSPANVSTVRTLPRVAEHSVGTAALVTGLRCRTGDVACTVDLEPDLARQRDWRGRADPVGLLQWPGRRLFVQHLLDDWIFARRYIHGEHAVLGPRLDRVAKRLCEAARASEADEVLVLGHSLGAVLAIDLLDRALRLEPRLGQDRSAVCRIIHSENWAAPSRGTVSSGGRAGREGACHLLGRLPNAHRCDELLQGRPRS